MVALPGLPVRRPPPITAQLVAALARLRAARAGGDTDREWAAEEMLDGLLDRYLQGHR